MKQKYGPPRERRFTPAQEREHRAHEARGDYVVAHLEQFLELLAAAYEWGMQEVVEAIGSVAHWQGRTFEEQLFNWWLGAFHPEESEWDFGALLINFEVYLSTLRKRAA
ncbi:MAG: hypothetical protein AUG51_09390 [Acidobacteria bacterium 13_1_20CM_3_53_8]|nr:MAG: hypothetical protein AUG51_09390 [Acidobacteria bacterium 13_1_20CM_3_53_8]